MRVLTFLLLAASISATGCDSMSRVFSSKKVTLPETQPISSSSLGQVATQCRKDVDRLKGKEDYVYEERQKEFDALVKIADDNCDELVTTYERMKIARHQEQSFRQNVQHAQSLVVGAVSANAGADADSFEEAGSYDVPATDAGSSAITSEPLS